MYRSRDDRQRGQNPDRCHGRVTCKERLSVVDAGTKELQQAVVEFANAFAT